MNTLTSEQKGPISLSPLHSAIASACLTNHWGSHNGITVVETYTDWQQEYDALRGHVGLQDFSSERRYRIQGKEAHDFLNRLATRDIAELQIGSRAFTPLCDDKGRVIDLVYIERRGADDFLLLSNVEMLCWLSDAAYGFEGVAFENVTGEKAILGLSGIASCATLLLAGFKGADKLAPLHGQTLTHKEISAYVTRTRALGELSYEIEVAPDDALVVWERLMRVGRPLGLKAVGRIAANICRIEAGQISLGDDFLGAHEAVYGNRPRTPFELGLRDYVDFTQKAHFCGRRALLKKSIEPERTLLMGIEVDADHAVTGARIELEERLVGTVTSSVWSPRLKRVIGFASLAKPVAELGRTYKLTVPHLLELEPVQEDYHVTLVPTKFYTSRACNARIS